VSFSTGGIVFVRPCPAQHILRQEGLCSFLRIPDRGGGNGVRRVGAVVRWGMDLQHPEKQVRGVNLLFLNQAMDEKMNYIMRIIKIILMIIFAVIALAVLLAYKMSVFLGTPGIKL